MKDNGLAIYKVIQVVLVLFCFCFLKKESQKSSIITSVIIYNDIQVALL